jgi:hypothetical protein
MHLFQYTVLLFGVAQAVTLQDAEDGFDALQQWYNQSIGETSPYPQTRSAYVRITNTTLQASGSLRLDGGIVPIVLPPNYPLESPITNTSQRSLRDSRSRRYRRQCQTRSSSHLREHPRPSPKIQPPNAKGRPGKLHTSILLLLRRRWRRPVSVPTRNDNAARPSPERFFERLLR